MTRLRAVLLALVAATLLPLATTAPAVAGHSPKPKSVRHMMFVGNNWDGTVNVFYPNGGFGHVATINAIPDIEERMAEIVADPVKLGFFVGIRLLIGEGHDQFVDDMYTSNDGELLIASRPSLGDVVAIDMDTNELVWRFVVDGVRSDHMAISPDGREVAVSASTGNVVHFLDVRTGEEIAKAPSGDSPHENVYSKDEERLFHASIGRVYTPTDEAALDTTKGEQYFQIIDLDDYEESYRFDPQEKLEEAGHPNMSSAMRPMTFSPDERFLYFQVSFFHGFVEYDFKKDEVTRVARLSIADHVKDLPRAGYLLDSAHHGIAMSGDGETLCVAGTMSDYVALVDVDDFDAKYFPRSGDKPYWATTTHNGKYCLVSWSATDQVSVFRFRDKKEIGRFDVGNHPQRIRIGNVQPDWLAEKRRTRRLPRSPLSR